MSQVVAFSRFVKLALKDAEDNSLILKIKKKKKK
jgi:hypothetical protein